MTKRIIALAAVFVFAVLAVLWIMPTINCPQPEFRSLHESRAPQVRAKLLENKKDVSPAEAAAVTANFLDVRLGVVRFDGERGGAMPVYRFTVGRTRVEVTKTGGYIFRAESSRMPATAGLPVQLAVDAAAQLVKACGFSDAAVTGHTQEGNCVRVLFARQEGDVTHGDEWIEVLYGRDGKLVSFDSYGYIVNFSADTTAQKAA